MTATLPSSFQSARRHGDDTALVRAVRRGDRAAQQLLCEQLYPIAWNVISTRTRGSLLSAEDIVQSTLERVLKSLTHGSFAGACSLHTWVKGIARIAVIDAYRATYREQEGLRAYADVYEELFDGEGLVTARDELRMVSARLKRMKTAYSMVIVTAGALGMTLQEAARHTNATVVATQSRLRRARARWCRR